MIYVAAWGLRMGLDDCCAFGALANANEVAWRAPLVSGNGRILEITPYGCAGGEWCRAAAII